MLKTLPQKEAIIASMDTAKTSIAGAEYVDKRLKEIFAKAKATEKFGPLIKVTEKFVTLTRHKLALDNQGWFGQTTAAPNFKDMQAELAKQAYYFRKIQGGLVKEALDELDHLFKGAKEEVAFDFAVSRESQFVRGYSLNGKALDTEATAAMDKLFNAWLVANNMVNKSGVLYEINYSGQIKLDEKGQQVKVNPEEIGVLMTEPSKGFIQYLETQGVKAVGHKQEFPSAEPEPRAST